MLKNYTIRYTSKTAYLQEVSVLAESSREALDYVRTHQRGGVAKAGSVEIDSFSVELLTETVENS